MSRGPATTRDKIAFWGNPEDPDHGTLRGYRTMLCPCPKCRGWNAEQSRKRRHGESGTPSPITTTQKEQYA